MSGPDLARFWSLLRDVPVSDDAEFLYGADAAGRLRTENLRRYLELIARNRPRVMLVGEAPGHRGHTISGISFTSVRQLTARPGLITGDPEGDGFRVPPEPAFGWEASSGVVWGAMASWRGPLPLFWPIFPHHPHEPGRPASNRTPRAAEVAAGAPVALALGEAFEIGTFVAVGRKAEAALARHGVPAVPVRHPAQGGARVFTRQLAELNAESTTAP
ncbi:uracil-DNA glycosylase [Actinacidiphila reveromycinica]|uniref:uracil-DNA glycosylase n=1 Tax=Actinacidiphila reveromycinica TaxID=659352 RepID=UPI0019220DE6|nr:uracil-DNA glycosylase [Streptomyces sp. SN-593]